MLLGISGLAGVGKDTVADLLVQHHGFVKVSLADPLKRICRDVFDFTDAQLWGQSELRNAPDPRYLHRRKGALGTTYVGERSLVGTSYEKVQHLVCDGHLPCPPEDEYLTPRYALQRLGTEWGRDCCQTVWVLHALRAAKKLLAGGFNYTPQTGLCTHASHLRPRGVVIPDVRFINEMDAIENAGGYLWRVSRPGYADAQWDHPSETQQLDVEDEEFAKVLANDGDLGDLDAVVRAMRWEGDVLA